VSLFSFKQKDAKRSKTKQNKAKQSKTKQNEAKQSKKDVKQNSKLERLSKTK
jgi:hypothetical protein